MYYMPTYNLGNGVTMQGIGLGTWQCSDEEVRATVLEALRVGYRHIDTAWMYMCEKGVGQGIKDWVADGGDRKDLCVVTKLPTNANRAEDVERLLDKQLSNLGLDYIEFYLIHGPIGMVNTGDDSEMFSKDEEGFFNHI
jgi:alcohol dehydrogenase (NADP+)